MHCSSENNGLVLVSHLCGGGPERIGGCIGIPGAPSLSRILDRNNEMGNSREASPITSCLLAS